MKRLPNKLKRIIKGERFYINTIAEGVNNGYSNQYKGLDVSCRITMVKADEEDWNDSVTPLKNKNVEWGAISVNLKVKGSIEIMGSNDRYKRTMEIGKATKTTPNYWGGYSSRTDYIWGHELHKRVREEIRVRVLSEVKVVVL